MSDDRTSKVYLGDAVYAEFEHPMIKLTTENGIDVTNTIYLEPQVFEALIKYANNFYDLSKCIERGHERE